MTHRHCRPCLTPPEFIAQRSYDSHARPSLSRSSLYGSTLGLRTVTGFCPDVRSPQFSVPGKVRKTRTVGRVAVRARRRRHGWCRGRRSRKILRFAGHTVVVAIQVGDVAVVSVVGIEPSLRNLRAPSLLRHRTTNPRHLRHLRLQRHRHRHHQRNRSHPIHPPHMDNELPTRTLHQDAESRYPRLDVPTLRSRLRLDT